jgi:hypothetical protein
MASQKWVDTGTVIDDRLFSRADTLWDGTKLYIVSHIFAADAGQPAAAGQRGELYRYSYQTTTAAFILDQGYPVEVTEGRSETLVLDKDSTGQLWVTYVENQKVMVNHSLNGDDRQWGKPYVLPAGGLENVARDDIASIIAYNEHVGIMWSNQQNGETMVFAVHPVGAPDSVWTPIRAYAESGDDHINLKSLQADSAGNIFAVVKTDDASQLIMLLVCKNNINRCKTVEDWDAYPVYSASTYNPTRPILLIDESNRHLYVFTRNQAQGREGGIYFKRADLDNIHFPTGLGTPFIRNEVDTEINDPTSTKQNLSAQTGLVILASDHSTRYYLHNYMRLGATANTPTISAFTPSSGFEGTEITLMGSAFDQVNAVAFNGTPAMEFTIASETQIRVRVPPGATSGRVSVTSPAGVGVSSSSFTVGEPLPLDYKLSLPLIGR